MALLPRTDPTTRTCIAAALALTAPLAFADDAPMFAPVGETDAAHLTLAPAAVHLEPEPRPARPEGTAALTTPPKVDEAPARLKFGEPGFQYVALGAGLASNGEDVDENIFGTYGYFIARRVEMFGEAGAWQFSQEGKDSTGFNLSMVIRWHFFESGRWTMFTDLGIGLLGATDPVPRRGGTEGTKFNFTPRIGGGFTRQLNDEGVRLEVGLRWAHVSNGRISGNNENPGRDSMMLYSGLIFPF